MNLSELRAELATGRVSLHARVNACAAAIEAHASLNAFVDVDVQGALRSAERLAGADDASPLFGAPVAIKDNLSVEGWPMNAGSRILEGYRAPEDATAVARLRRAGALLLGRTNMDEFAMGSASETGRTGPVENPAAPGRVAGGSSGGSAAAVAAGLVAVALGSDTGGSVRQPAAFCGIVGLKPTWGRVSRRGLLAFASSLDCVGPLATTVADAAATFAAIAGPDDGDPSTHGSPATFDWSSAVRSGVDGLTVGRFRPPLDIEPAVADAIDQAAAVLERAGASIVDVTLPHAEHALSAYLVIAAAEASSNLARFDGVRYGRRAPGASDLDAVYRRSRGEGLGPEVRRRILLGTFVLSAGQADAYFGQAARVRTLIVRDYAEAFEKVDILLSPTAPEIPFLRHSRQADPLAMYSSDVLTVGPSLAGLPALSVPAPVPQETLPIGAQLIAPWHREDRLMAAGASLEAANAVGK